MNSMRCHGSVQLEIHFGILGVVYLNNQRVEEVKVCKSLNLKVTNVA